MDLAVNLLQGIVVETRAESLTGHYFYSDRMHSDEPTSIEIQPFLNQLSTINIIGIAAGIIRMALAIIHCIGHLFATILTFNKGHLFHVAKGGCEFLRGFIEAIPFIGRIFANVYYHHGEWWIIKIYNPMRPDTLDEYANNWDSFKENRPSAYFVC